MPGFHKPVLAAISAVVVSASMAAGGAAVHTASPVSLVADIHVAEPTDPVPGDQDTNMQKVSANTASEDVIASALKAAGVASPKRWAAEVVEYRPYPTDDLGLAKLRENLAKYNPAGQTVDQIVSVLLP